MKELSLSPTPSQHWDIFCTVVDNYGDIGVTWRLAKQLADEYQLAVNLWVDDLRSFQFILPELDIELVEQTHQRVNIIKWQQPLTRQWQAGAALIEAFACELPDEITAATASVSPFPLWINLEYLSAEVWIDDCHGLNSPVKNGVKKRFFFPGFSEKSGGLLCEADLFERRDAWRRNNQRFSLYERLGIDSVQPEDQVISLFSYETSAINAMCQQLIDGERVTHLLVPRGRALTSVADALATTTEQLFQQRHYLQGKLALHVLPMTNQEQYDQLLWSCDFNIVRGEDSFLRAQWAGKPFIWHIYPQDEDAHIDKLQAFMQRYCQLLPLDAANTWQQLNLAFNQNAPSVFSDNWQSLQHHGVTLAQHAEIWPKTAISYADLAKRLVQMVKNG
ncbi:elongation factor P maturation arginine rhamnosyltransferase EarP [Shewanella sp.]|uniref:elongation factor P maturation arginine rhamnosyltransferase EarP n=1 Tax=Shewanella sp. TaxID=50422 RepID=UPI003A97976F